MNPRSSLSTVALTCALLSLAALSHAQSYRPPPPETPLSAAARDKLARLHALQELPAEAWRVHVGDLPHGEAVALDDSSWPEVKATYTAGTGAVWFRRRITVPKTLNGYDLSGSRI